MMLAREVAHDARAVSAHRAIVLHGNARAIAAGTVREYGSAAETPRQRGPAHPPGTPVPVASLNAEAVVEIHDEDERVALAHLSHAFERFYRVDPWPQPRRRWLVGSGPAIVGAIMTTHGGAVEVAAAPGRGTTVRVTFAISASLTDRTLQQARSTGARTLHRSLRSRGSRFW